MGQQMNSSILAREVDHDANYIVAISSGIAGAIGLPGNLFLIAVLWRKFAHRKPYEWFFFHFAFIHAFLCFNGLFLQTVYIIDFQNVGCQIAGFINYFFTVLGFCIPPLIGVNQYLNTYGYHSAETLFKPRKLVFMSVIPWFLATFLCLPFLITDNFGLDETGICDVQVTTSGAEYLAVCGFQTPMLLSYCISGFFTYKVVDRIIKHKNMVTDLARSQVVEESREIIIPVVAFLIVPLFTQIPGFVCKTVQIFISVDPWISRITIAPFFLAPALYPYLTLYTIPRYRKTVKRLLQRGTAPRSTS